jgi:hypothetical protein
LNSNNKITYGTARADLLHRKKQTGAQTGVKLEQQILLHIPAARFLISGAENEVLT